jgi:hypothetical protein
MVFAVCLFLDVRGASREWILFGGFEIFIVVTLQPLFRPFNSNLLAESLVGKKGVSRGDFIRAWAVLPVGRTAVLRKVWWHGTVVGMVLWSVPVVVLIVRQWMIEGHWSFKAGMGGLMQLVVAGGFLVPVIAGLLVAVAVGRRLEYVMSGLSLLLGIQAVFLVKIGLQEVFGRGSTFAEAGTVLALIVLVFIGAAPPLRFLWKAHLPA